MKKLKYLLLSTILLLCGCSNEGEYPDYYAVQTILAQYNKQPVLVDVDYVEWQMKGDNFVNVYEIDLYWPSSISEKIYSKDSYVAYVEYLMDPVSNATGVKFENCKLLENDIVSVEYYEVRDFI